MTPQALAKQIETNALTMYDIEQQIAKRVNTQVTELERLREADSKLREQLKDVMEATDTKNFEVGNVSVTYIAPQVRTIIDSAKLKKEQPETWESYSKASHVKSQIRITVKNANDDSFGIEDVGF